MRAWRRLLRITVRLGREALCSGWIASSPAARQRWKPAPAARTPFGGCSGKCSPRCRERRPAIHTGNSLRPRHPWRASKAPGTGPAAERNRSIRSLSRESAGRSISPFSAERLLLGSGLPFVHHESSLMELETTAGFGPPGRNGLTGPRLARLPVWRATSTWIRRRGRVASRFGDAVQPRARALRATRCRMRLRLATATVVLSARMRVRSRI